MKTIRESYMVDNFVSNSFRYQLAKLFQTRTLQFDKIITFIQCLKRPYVSETLLSWTRNLLRCCYGDCRISPTEHETTCCSVLRIIFAC